MFAAFAIASALFGRERSRRGTNIDVSMTDGVVSWMSTYLSLAMDDKAPFEILGEPAYGIFDVKGGRRITLNIALNFHRSRAERYDLCAICEKSISDRQFKISEAQDLAALIAHQMFTSIPVLEVTSPGIPRSRRQLAGLSPKACYGRAVSDFGRVIDIDPQHATAYYNRGTMYRARGDNNGAIADYSRAIQINRRYMDAYFNRGNRYYEMGEPDRAISDYSKVIELAPRDADAYLSRGRAYYDKKDNDRAIADYSKAIELNQQNANAYFDRGNAYFGKNDHDRAIVDYSKAMELNPQYAEAYYNRAVAYNVKGDKERSDADAGKAAQLDPRYARQPAK